MEKYCNYSEYVQSYFNGTLDSFSETKLFNHIKQCSKCGAEFAKMQKISNHFKYMQNLKCPEDFDIELYSKLVESTHKTKINTSKLTPKAKINISKFLVPIGITLFIAFNVVFLVLLISTTKTEVKKKESVATVKQSQKQDTKNTAGITVSKIPIVQETPEQEDKKNTTINTPESQTKPIIPEVVINTPQEQNTKAPPTEPPKVTQPVKKIQPTQTPVPKPQVKVPNKNTTVATPKSTVKKPTTKKTSSKKPATHKTTTPKSTKVSKATTTKKAQTPAKPKSTKTSVRLTFTTLSKGATCNQQMPNDYSFKDKSSFAAFWRSTFGSGKPVPSIDFSKYMVLAVTQGLRNTSGYSIRISSVTEKQNSVEVYVVGTGPKNEMINYVSTSPFHIIKVKKVSKRISFIWR